MHAESGWQRVGARQSNNCYIVNAILLGPSSSFNAHNKWLTGMLSVPMQRWSGPLTWCCCSRDAQVQSLGCSGTPCSRGLLGLHCVVFEVRVWAGACCSQPPILVQCPPLKYPPPPLAIPSPPQGGGDRYFTGLQYVLQWFVFPMCHTQVLALFSHYF